MSTGAYRTIRLLSGRRQDRDFRSTIRSTKSAVLYDFGGFRRSPRAIKSLKNLERQDCHGRGRGFEPRRPRHKLEENKWFMAMITSFIQPPRVSKGAAARPLQEGF